MFPHQITEQEKEKWHGFLIPIHPCGLAISMLPVVLLVNLLHKVAFVEEEKQPDLVFFMEYVKCAKWLML